jgi:hypothetical protein
MKEVEYIIDPAVLNNLLEIKYKDYKKFTIILKNPAKLKTPDPNKPLKFKKYILITKKDIKTPTKQIIEKMNFKVVAIYHRRDNSNVAILKDTLEVQEKKTMKIDWEKTDDDLEEEDIKKRLDFAKNQLNISKNFLEKAKKHLKSYVKFEKMIIFQNIRVGGKHYDTLRFKEAYIYSKEQNLPPNCLGNTRDYKISIIEYDPEKKIGHLFVKKK